MTQSAARNARRKAVIAPAKRNLTPIEAMELQEMHRVAAGRKFEADQIQGNTALVPDGQKLGEQTRAVANLLENAKRLWISKKLRECGYTAGENCSISFSTGEIALEK